MKNQVITANALIEGDVVYLAPSGQWVRHLSDAQVFTDDAEADAALHAAAARSNEAVGAYLITVTLQDGIPGPTHFREAFRLRGPSNRFHGKQAEHVDLNDV